MTDREKCLATLKVAQEEFAVCVGNDKFYLVIGQALDFAINDIEKRGSEAPAVDAEEVVHSRWELVTTKWMPPQLVRVGYCQNRKEERPVDNYCPNCGARMDGE